MEACKLNRRRGLGVIAGWMAGLALGWPQIGWAQDRPSRVTTWEELVPKGWDPLKDLGLGDPSKIREGSVDEIEVMKALRKLWDDAPTRRELDGAGIRLPGYVVPLDSAAGGQVTEFLLVPYFGACIHSPPPPANQIVHVKLASPAPWRTMQAVWVNGRITVDRRDSAMGTSGYSVAADRVEAYRAPER